jgi:translation initiation factor 3 subunit F|eukprot:TRINITY_DN61970_c0_g1_i1.p1 TRINITY_DN61970_c0_g1~~TRINITY_DN61970_c0_g1_i1.p1  ORF type:complete len:377 (+),score=75.66 TRINITY_DN61970_c0_g1_i1:84-1214(+)
MATGQALWGLSAKKQHPNPPKCFNITSRNGVEQPLTCRMHPVAIVKILDAFSRRPEHASRTIGTLLGSITEGSIVDITDSFPVVHQDTDERVLMDQDYHKQMLALRQKVSPREVVVGWFSTGSEIIPTSAVIHSFYCTKESQFTATAMLPGPMHLLIDTSSTLQSISVKAFVNVRTTVAESLLQFREVPLQVQTSAAEKAGVSQLMQARRASRETAATGGPPKDITTIDGFTLGLKELLALFRRIQEYVRAVQSGAVEGDLAVGRGLMAQLCAEPVIDATAVESLCTSSLQDALMVVYLSNLTRTQISIAEKIQSLYSDPADQPAGGGGGGGATGGGGYDNYYGGDRQQDNRSNMICKQWQNGNCTFGDRCRFHHA